MKYAVIMKFVEPPPPRFAEGKTSDKSRSQEHPGS
jgi:hypothetical protein